MESHLQLFDARTWHDCAVVTPPDIGGVNSRTLLEYDLEYVFGSMREPASEPFPVVAANLSLNHRAASASK